MKGGIVLIYRDSSRLVKVRIVLICRVLSCTINDPVSESKHKDMVKSQLQVLFVLGALCKAWEARTLFLHTFFMRVTLESLVKREQVPVLERVE